ncbi:hypothetical protein EPH05_00665 [Ureaplasma urealyticum]|nr:hypothetical protein EPH05_00665 [Ureaplasma urealyticum]
MNNIYIQLLDIRFIKNSKIKFFISCYEEEESYYIKKNKDFNLTDWKIRPWQEARSDIYKYMDQFSKYY